MSTGPSDSLSTGHSGGCLPRLGAIGKVKAVAKSTAKRAIDVYFSTKVAFLRGIGLIDFPVPPDHNLRTTSSTTIRHYYESGLTTLMPIVTSALTFGVDLDKPVNVLDFGCGVGRQLLHLTRLYPNVRAYGCDVNDDAIAYMLRSYPGVKTYASSFDPPLTYDDCNFDLVYSVSVFSHLSEQDARVWLSELRRITKPFSILCLTFNSFTSLDRSHQQGRRLQYNAEQLERDGLVFDADENSFALKKAAQSVSRFGANLIGITRIYGEMYYSHERVKALFKESGLEVLSVLPGVIDRLQDLAVVRRPRA